MARYPELNVTVSVIRRKRLLRRLGKHQTNIPARPFTETKPKYKKKSKEKAKVYTHCDLHHILYPSASSRPQQQNFKPAVEKYKWEQCSCPHL